MGKIPYVEFTIAEYKDERYVHYPITTYLFSEIIELIKKLIDM